MPETMVAWVIREERFGEPRDAFQLEQIEIPEPGAMEVVVRVMAAGVNYNNVWAAPSQQIWGYETTWGSFAEYCKVQAQQLLPKPPALTWEEAASYGLTYFTAYRMLVRQAGLQEGHRVLIWGAAGGLGGVAPPRCSRCGRSARS